MYLRHPMYYYFAFKHLLPGVFILQVSKGNSDGSMWRVKYNYSDKHIPIFWKLNIMSIIWWNVLHCKAHPYYAYATQGRTRWRSSESSLDKLEQRWAENRYIVRRMTDDGWQMRDDGWRMSDDGWEMTDDRLQMA